MKGRINIYNKYFNNKVIFSILGVSFSRCRFRVLGQLEVIIHLFQSESEVSHL
jgi:hypothetical protein